MEEAPHGALGDPQPVLALQMGRDLRQCHVRGLFDQRQDRFGSCLDPLRAPVAALRPGPVAARQTPGPDPLDRRRRRDPEAFGRSPPSPPGGADHPKEVVSCRLASFTSLNLESHIQAIANSKDSVSSENALALPVRAGLPCTFAVVLRPVPPGQPRAVGFGAVAQWRSGAVAQWRSGAGRHPSLRIVIKKLVRDTGCLVIAFRS